MDTDPDHDRDKKAEKAAVLLALAADPGEAAGPCLTAEAMAALVDGRVKAPASAAYLAHLGGCGRCYEEWLLLKKERDLGTPRRRVYDLHRLKKISYIGSALAVAASIAVYLNVGNMAEQPLEQAVPGTVLMTDHAVGPAPQSQTPEKKKQEQGQPPARQNGTGRTAVPAAPAIVGEQALGRPEAVPAPPAERDQPSGAPRRQARWQRRPLRLRSTGRQSRQRPRGMRRWPNGSSNSARPALPSDTAPTSGPR
jgi:hypothetical protein